jgi:outer membrane protein assembly factor BamB
MLQEETTRRRFLRATGGAAVGGALLYGSSAPAVAQSDEAWPEFGYNSKNTGYAPSNTGPLANVGEDWTFETRDEIDSPVVVDDIIYVGSQDNTIYAVNATDGAERWRYETTDIVVSSASVVGDTVYIGSTSSTVYALDAGTGSVEWSTETGDGVTSLTVADGTVYAADFGNTLFALDAMRGSERWQFDTGERVPSQPVVLNDTVYFGTGVYYRDTVIHMSTQ